MIQVQDVGFVEVGLYIHRKVYGIASVSIVVPQAMVARGTDGLCRLPIGFGVRVPYVHAPDSQGLRVDDD